ncbi:MAG: hypothetical protein QGH70_12585 [Nitrospinota bacterium]|jgi:cytochrome c556|nr:hypothetical protein [Nitrospinota bacterium]MDP6484662.1 hypothetical protein [Nitrospinota bacterium]MDP6620531.1 hypothetical protein [Nitrospinota bacterium]HJM41972.1 hypothetical protein [Nitrospinota bacterium]
MNRKKLTIALLAAGLLAAAATARARHPVPRSYIMKCKGEGSV